MQMKVCMCIASATFFQTERFKVSYVAQALAEACDDGFGGHVKGHDTI